MGKVMSIATRKVQRFNVENRAHKLIGRDKPLAAPKYDSNIMDYQKVLEDNPDFLATQSKKHTALDDRLKQVYVTSTDPVATVPIRNDPRSDGDSVKNLPLDRHAVEDFEYGFKEPVKVSRGRTTLRQAIKFISDHQNDPNTWSVQQIASEYKLKEDNVAKVLENFHTFEIYIPDTKTRENVLIHTPAKQQMLELQEPRKKPTEDYDEMEEEMRPKDLPEKKDSHGRY